MTKKKVLLGMSGGVDSSVAALILQKQGYEVTGVTMRLRPDRFMKQSSAGGCCSLDDIDDARRVCYKLGIDHIVMNFSEQFERNVIDYFAKEYQIGRTPNPCIACNKHLKFGSLLQRAQELDFDYVATGHYAKIEQDPITGRWLLKKSPASKDQSYVLYSFTQFQLAHTLMPLCNMQKDEARLLAEKANLPVAHKPDSQEICFVEDNDYAGFIERYTGEKSLSGNFIDEKGAILGKHKGIMHYTIGQRKGLGLSFGEPRYVTSIDPVTGNITLGREGSQYASALVADSLNFIPFDSLTSPLQVDAKVRYNSRPAPATIYPASNGQARIVFETPQRSITPGQAVVFYQGDLVLGGGTILRSETTE